MGIMVLTGAGERRARTPRRGRGPVVVLGHGFAGSARNFLPQARALRDRYRIVRFDARGHARSGAPAEAAAYTPEAFVADVGRVLDQVGAQRAVVGGLSMGAGIALRFALAHPERVRALVLAAFPPGRRAAGAAGRGRGRRARRQPGRAGRLQRRAGGVPGQGDGSARGEPIGTAAVTGAGTPLRPPCSTTSLRAAPPAGPRLASASS